MIEVDNFDSLDKAAAVLRHRAIYLESDSSEEQRRNSLRAIFVLEKDNGYPFSDPHIDKELRVFFDHEVSANDIAAVEEIQ